MFRGNHPARVDDKGRLKVPADHKRTVDEKYGSVFFITSVDGERAELYPMKQWEQVEETLAKMPSSGAKQKFLDVTGYYGQQVELDSQGRLLIPQLLRKKANLDGDVAVIGQGTKLIVVSEARHVEKIEAAPLTGADLDSLGLAGV